MIHLQVFGANTDIHKRGGMCGRAEEISFVVSIPEITEKPLVERYAPLMFGRN